MSDNESKGHIPAGLILKPHPLPPVHRAIVPSHRGRGKAFTPRTLVGAPLCLGSEARKSVSDCFCAVFASKGQEKAKDFHVTDT